MISHVINIWLENVGIIMKNEVKKTVVTNASGLHTNYRLYS
jgi:hypothetical protein